MEQRFELKYMSNDMVSSLTFTFQVLERIHLHKETQDFCIIFTFMLLHYVCDLGQFPPAGSL